MAMLVSRPSILASPIRVRLHWQFGVVVTTLAVQFFAFASAVAEESPSSEPLRKLGESEFRLTYDEHIRDFRFSPDGKLLAGANWDEIRIWTFPEGKLLHDFSSSLKSNCIAFNADGSQLLAFDERYMEIFRFNVSNGELIGRTKLEDVVDEKGATTYSLSEDGRWLCYTEVYSHVGAWDTETGARHFHKKLHPYYAARTSRKGVITLFYGPFIDRYNARTGEQIARIRTHDFLQGIVSNLEGTLLAGSSPQEKAVVFWDPEQEQRVGGKIPLEHDEWRPNEAAMSSDGRRIVLSINKGPSASAHERRMAVFDVDTGKVISTFDPPAVYFVDQTILSPDGRFSLPIGQAALCAIDNRTGRAYRETSDHTQEIQALSFTPDSKTLLVGSRDKQQAWNAQSGEPGIVLEKWYSTPYLIAVDNRRALVSGLRHGGIRLQEIKTGTIEGDYEKNTNKHLSALQLSSDRGHFVGIFYENESPVIRRWNIDTGEVIAERKYPKRPSGFRVSSDEAIRGLAVGGTRILKLKRTESPKELPDGSIDWGRYELLLEDWETAEVEMRLAIPQSGRFSFADPVSGNVLAAVVSNSYIPPYKSPWGSTYLMVWDTATGQELLRLERQMDNYFSAFLNVAVTPDARLAATSRFNDRIEIWEVATGKRVQTLKTGSGITALTFSDDGALLASGHQDGSVLLWDTKATYDNSPSPTPSQRNNSTN